MLNVYSMHSNKTDQNKNKPFCNNELTFLWQCNEKTEYIYLHCTEHDRSVAGQRFKLE